MLYLAIPAHNEAATIGVLLWRLRTVLSEFPREYEAVVYDDASSDSTSEILQSYQRVMPLTILRGERPVGYAGAINALVRHVARQTRYPRRDAMLLLQGDFTDPPAMIPEFLKRFEGGADLVIGERTGGALRLAPLPVKRMQLMSGWIVRLFVKADVVRDVTSSFRLIRISVLRDLMRRVGDAPVCAGNSQTANADFLLHLIPLARRVETIPVEPTWGVRLRDTRLEGLKDGLAVATWAWKARGRKVVASTAPDTVDSPRANRPTRERDHSNVLQFEPVEPSRASHVRSGAPDLMGAPTRRARPQRAATEPEDDAAIGGLGSQRIKPARRKRSRGARKELGTESFPANQSDGVDAPPEANALSHEPPRRHVATDTTVDAPGQPVPLSTEVSALSPALSDIAEAAEAMFDAETPEARPLRKRRRRRGSRKGKREPGDTIDAAEENSDGSNSSQSEVDTAEVRSAGGDDADTGAAIDESDTEGSGERAEGETRARRRGRRGRRGGSRRNRESFGEPSSALGDDDAVNSAPDTAEHTEQPTRNVARDGVTPPAPE